MTSRDGLVARWPGCFGRWSFSLILEVLLSFFFFFFFLFFFFFFLFFFFFFFFFVGLVFLSLLAFSVHSDAA